jgi:galactokinase
MVEIASGLDGVFGARMTGGGFGGCTVSLVRRDCVEKFRHVLTERYEKVTGLPPEVYVCRAAPGVEEMADDWNTDSPCV